MGQKVMKDVVQMTKGDGGVMEWLVFGWGVHPGSKDATWVMSRSRSEMLPQHPRCVFQALCWYF